MIAGDHRPAVPAPAHAPAASLSQCFSPATSMSTACFAAASAGVPSSASSAAKASLLSARRRMVLRLSGVDCFDVHFPADGSMGFGFSKDDERLLSMLCAHCSVFLKHLDG